MKATRRPATVDECIGSLQREFIAHPLLQAKRKISAAGAAGSIELAFYRGRHAGRYDAYLALCDKHPRAALEVLRAFGMDEEGTSGSERSQEIQKSRRRTR